MTTDAVHFYWRPGCPFCSMLRRGLDKAGLETVDHNIWDDPEAATIVRSYADGNETVPTVVVGGVGMVNPSAKQVLQHLSGAAPHLLPAESPEQAGLLDRLRGA